MVTESPTTMLPLNFIVAHLALLCHLRSTSPRQKQPLQRWLQSLTSASQPQRSSYSSQSHPFLPERTVERFSKVE